MTTSTTPTTGTTARLRGVVAIRGGVRALEVASLDLHPGLTSLIGPNGSGKSTLLHLLSGLITPSDGSVDVLGRPAAAARAEVSYVLQAQHAPRQLPITAREVVGLGRAPVRGAFHRLGRDDRRRVDDALDRLGVLELAERHLSEMSGGQRQRVLIAQGIVQDAEVLLLDEPMAALDLVSAALVSTVIDGERRRGRTVVVTTHDLDEAAHADQVVLLAGRVVAAGPPVEVLTPQALRIAYSGRVLDLAGGAVMLDDGAHHDHDHGPGHSHGQDPAQDLAHPPHG